MSNHLFNKEISFGLLPFETIYFDEKGPQFLWEHYNRLKRGHRILKFKFELKFDDFNNKIVEEIGKIERPYGILKVIYFDDKLNIQFREFTYTQQQFMNGIKLRTSKCIRDSKNILNYLKTFNYGINYIEDKRAKEKGFHSALFLNEKGFICETSYANIFFAKGKKIHTPHISSGILKGIMREDVIKTLKNKGYKVIKDFIPFEDAEEFDECFITNSVIGVLPVSKIDNLTFKGRNVFETISKEDRFLRNWIK